jgi:hypothetical protein
MAFALSTPNQISEVLLTPGDFVEFDLVINRKSSHGRMLKVHLTFNHLIRLSKARKPPPEIEVVVISAMQTLFCRTECASIGW